MIDTLPYDRPETHSDRHNPVHESDITESGLIAAVRRAYRDTEPNKTVDTDGRRRLKFVSDWHSAKDPIDVVTAIGFIGRYNRFEPDDVAEAIKQLPAETYVAVGREGSPVIYLWTDTPAGVLNAAEKLNPDELSLTFNPDSYPNPKQGEHVWVDEPNKIRYLKDGGNTRYTRRLETPVGSVRHPGTGLRSDGPALIRLWWD